MQLIRPIRCGKSALVIGPGPVGQRAAVLLAGEGCEVQLGSIPTQLLGDRFNADLAQGTLASGHRAADRFGAGPAAAAGGRLDVTDLKGIEAMDSLLDKTEILVAAGPAGLRMLPLASWKNRPNMKFLLDFNLTDPLGIEGIKPGDDFAEYESKCALGALAIGNAKMKVHKACISRLFERNDLVLDTEGVYIIAKELT
jgi:methylenetetrahydrofolate/methylenetetrahydromethanopterin dehydrogenase (NADP+)